MLQDELNVSTQATVRVGRRVSDRASSYPPLPHSSGHDELLVMVALADFDRYVLSRAWAFHCQLALFRADSSAWCRAFNERDDEMIRVQAGSHSIDGKERWHCSLPTSAVASGGLPVHCQCIAGGLHGIAARRSAASSCWSTLGRHLLVPLEFEQHRNIMPHIEIRVQRHISQA